MSWPLIGRDEERALLVSELSENRGRAFLSGPPGVGKTRLAEEVVAALDVEPSLVEWIAATRGTSSIPFGAFAHLLPSDFETGDRLTMLRTISEGLRGRIRRGLVVVVDDAHLLDDGSAATVYHLARTEPVRMVITVRTGESAPDSISELWKQHLAIRIELQPLSRIEVDQILDRVLTGRIDGELRRRVWHLTRGNPLFAHELVVAERTAGRMHIKEGRWVWDAPERLAARLREIVEMRIAGLDDADRSALEAVALAEPVGLDDLLDALDDPIAIDRLAAQGLVTIGAHSRVRTGHPLYGEVLRAAAPPVRGRRLRLALADALDASGAPEDVLRSVTWRLENGGDPSPDQLVRAARIAHERFDRQLAERLARAALDAGGGVEAAIALARALNQLNRFDEADEVLRQHEEAVETIAPRYRRRYALARYRSLLPGLGRTQEALEALRRLAVIDDRPGWRLYVSALEAQALADTGRFEEALALARPIFEDAEVDADTRIVAAYPTGGALWLTGRSAEALDVYDTAIELAAGNPEEVSTLHYERLGPLHHTGPAPMDGAAALARYREAADAGWDHGRGLWAQAIGIGLTLRGMLRAGCDWLQEAAASFERSDPAGFVVVCYAQLATAHAMLGDVTSAEGWIDRARDRFHADISFNVGPFSFAGIWIAFAEGRLVDAQEAILERAERARTAGNAFGEASSLHWALQLGCAPRPIAERLTELAERGESKLVGLWGRQARGVADGDGEDLEELSRVYGSLENDLWAAASAAQASRAFAAAGRADSARRLATRAGLLTENIDGPRTPALSPAPQRGTAELTTREREIAVLAARGHANAEIAEILTLSVRTVETHLHRAYAKLGVNRRTDLRGVLDDG